MNTILNKAENAVKLLKLTSDTLVLLDKNGVCVDIAVHNANLWFLKEKTLLGKNVFDLIPPSTYQHIYPEFQKVLNQGVRSVCNDELTFKNRTYFFKCIMSPYEDMVLCQYRDITERSQRKLELEKKNYELQEIQKAASIGRWRYHSGSTNFHYSGHTGIMCTEEEQEIQIDDYAKHILPEDRNTFYNWLQQSIQGNLEDSVDYRVYLQQQIFHIRLKTFLREKQKNGSIRLEGYIQNVTDVQQRRNDINLLTHAINNSAEDIFAAREDGTLVFANRRFKQHHNINTADDITQLKIYEINPHIKNEQTWRKLTSYIKKDKDHNSFILHNPLPLFPEILAMEGNAYWVTCDEGYETIWAFGRDITLRIKNEQKIKQFSQILDKTIENLPASIVVKDIQSDFKYIYRNRELYNRNISTKEAMGKDDFDFHPFEVAHEKRLQDIEIANTGTDKHWIIEESDPNGQTIYLDKRKMRIESKDFPPILLSIEWDITETERMKRELIIAKEKAEASDQLKSAFLANMSHEIRTPLNAIVGFSRIIAESVNAEERKEYYDIIESNNERLLKLINEILDLSKIEAGIVEFTITSVPLHPLCKEIHDALNFRCPKNVKLIYDASEQDVVIEGDKNRIFQVISNLIGNAFKFTTSGAISYGYCRKGNMIEFHVSDTGIGIEADKLHKVFERFVKVNTFAQGTGLGLSICKTIIERLGGTISASSVFGEGTTFTFTLPLPCKESTNNTEIGTPEANPQTSIEKAQDTEENKASNVYNNEDKEGVDSSKREKIVLIAEDTDSNYILAKAILKHTYKLERARDGIEAVSMFEQVRPDLILMDMKMPNLGGLDATRIIRELSPDIPIIALTAYAYEHDRQAALEAGCNDFLTKPFTQEGLKMVISKHLNKD